MKNGFATFENIWHGTKANRYDIDTIPFFGEFKVNYTLNCEKEGNILIGIIVDNNLIQVYEYKIKTSSIGSEANFWFKYPLRYKTEGEHKVNIAIGEQVQLSDETDVLDIKWVYKSPMSMLTVKK